MRVGFALIGLTFAVLGCRSTTEVAPSSGVSVKVAHPVDITDQLIALAKKQQEIVQSDRASASALDHFAERDDANQVEAIKVYRAALDPLADTLEEVERLANLDGAVYRSESLDSAATIKNVVQKLTQLATLDAAEGHSESAVAQLKSAYRLHELLFNSSDDVTVKLIALALRGIIQNGARNCIAAAPKSAIQFASTIPPSDDSLIQLFKEVDPGSETPFLRLKTADACIAARAIWMQNGQPPSPMPKDGYGSELHTLERGQMRVVYSPNKIEGTPSAPSDPNKIAIWCEAGHWWNARLSPEIWTMRDIVEPH